MIDKVVGYQGFQSYGILPYPSLKSGQPTLDTNTKWAQTQRQEDIQPLYLNGNYQSTVYDQKMNTNVNPDSFKNHQIVKKGAGFESDAKRSGFLAQTANNNLAQTANPELLKTGVEHWRTTYQDSTDHPFEHARPSQPEWSKHKAPHVVCTKVGPTEYKNIYGQRGHNPRHIMDHTTEWPPKMNDDLRNGTTQMTEHTPGYTGFLPAALTSNDAIDNVKAGNERHDFLKLNLKENYHIHIPGYAGHIPKAKKNQVHIQLRDSCLGTGKQE